MHTGLINPVRDAYGEGLEKGFGRAIYSRRRSSDGESRNLTVAEILNSFIPPILRHIHASNSQSISPPAGSAACISVIDFQAVEWNCTFTPLDT